ncbi:hypothetical protein [Candidatus Methylobacter favarea]|uniref:hypothetical protein n=1 Tax=Candidatus Methylobacter favarea TaxID=2707345 RepID=UPI00157C45D6|nr:hypothetical protein [Candidatus Methylobacter favarea]
MNIKLQATLLALIISGCTTGTYKFDLNGSSLAIPRSGCNFYDGTFQNNSGRDLGYWYGNLIALDASKTTLGTVDFACFPSVSTGKSKCQINGNNIRFSTAGLGCRNINDIRVRPN